MGFKHWYEGLEVISWFLIVVGVPCFFVGLWGSKMINDLGNHPSQSPKIQAAGSLKIFLVEIISFLLMLGLFIFLYNLNNE